MEQLSYLYKLTHNMNLINLLKTLGLSLIAFLAPIKGLIIIVGLLAILDTCYAMYAAHKKSEELTWKKFKLIFLKIAFHWITIAICFLIDVYIVGGPILGFSYALSKSITIFWCWQEIQSLDATNISLGGKPFADRIKEMLNFFKGIKKDIGDLTDKDDDKTNE